MMIGFDWIIAVIFVVSILIGIWRGFLKESLSLIAWILAYYFAKTYDLEVGALISNHIFEMPSPIFRAWSGFALIFILVLFGLTVVNYIILRIFARKPVKGIDRILGIGFAAVRAAAIVVLVLFFLRGLGFGESDWWKGSNLIVHFIPYVDYFENSILPEQWRTDAGNGDTLQKMAVDKVIDSKR